MNRFGMLGRFWVAWILYWLLFFIQPIQSIYPDTCLAWLLQLLFVLTVSLAYGFGSILVSFCSPAVRGATINIDPIRVYSIIRWGLQISLLGLAFLIYDKIFIQKIDYTMGLAGAREQWRLLGEARNGRVSSIFSAIGYIFGGGFFLPLGLLLSRRVVIPDAKRFRLFLMSVFLLMSNSLLTGGRSNILLALTIASFGYFSSGQHTTLWRSSFVRILFLTTALIPAIYALYVFRSRAVGSDLEITQYAVSFHEYLGLKLAPGFEKFVISSRVGGVLSVINLAASYLTHSLATAAAIIRNGVDNGDAIFGYLLTLGAKLGVSSPPTEWFLSGRFPSMPGALYLEFGIPGILYGASVTGIIAGIACSLFVQRPGSAFCFLGCASLESVLLLSPFLFAGDFLFFPFMLTGGLLAITVGENFKIYGSKYGNGRCARIYHNTGVPRGDDR